MVNDLLKNDNSPNSLNIEETLLGKVTYYKRNKLTS